MVQMTLSTERENNQAHTQFVLNTLTVVKEASIPLTDNVYCPFPNCYALMSKDEVKKPTPTSSSTADGDTGMSRCVVCNRYFCIDCWNECIKCKNSVELAFGCYHIYCTCGYEFFYTCGVERVNKKPACRCPLWKESNILYA
ncbi:putative IBR domain, E3 ubiquitin ligase RBR family [Helianthus anomalus]